MKGTLVPLMARAKKQIAKRAAAREDRSGDRTVATNRRARREYEFLETFEAGIVLQGSEVKSLREGKAQLSEAYARVDDGELWLFQLHIPPWQYATGFGAHDPDRKRKLLRAPVPDRRADGQDAAAVVDPDPGLPLLPGRQGEGAAGPGQGAPALRQAQRDHGPGRRAGGRPGGQGDEPLERRVGEASGAGRWVEAAEAVEWSDRSL